VAFPWRLGNPLPEIRDRKRQSPLNHMMNKMMDEVVQRRNGIHGGIKH